MIEQFEKELENIDVEHIVKIINKIAGYELLNNVVGYSSLPDNFEDKVLKYTSTFKKEKDTYGTWTICWNKVWDKSISKFIYYNQLRFSLLDYEFQTLNEDLDDKQQETMRKEIKNYIKTACPSYIRAIKDIFNKKREEINKQEEDLIKNY